MELQSERYYQGSGIAPAGGLALMMACGLGAAAVAAIVSALISLYNPIAIISIVGPILCGIAVGGTVRFAAKAGQVRSRSAVWGTGLIMGVIAVYFSWVAYLSLFFRDVPMLQQILGPVIYLPTTIWDLMRLNALNGVWSIKSFTPTGWQLYLVWAAEACLVVGFAITVASGGTTPFCESCGCWAEKTVDKGLFERPADVRQVQRAMEEERYDVLDQLQLGSDTSPELLETIVHCCPRCTESTFLSMNHTPMQTDKHGARSKAATNLMFANLKIPRSLADRLAYEGSVEEAAPAKVETQETEQG